MTFVQQMRFTCDRCRQTEIVPLQNTPGTVRFGGPSPGWTPIVVGDPANPTKHFCPKCTTDFERFMEGDPSGPQTNGNAGKGAQ